MAVAATRSLYAELRTPYHSRWCHVEAGGVDRRAQLDDLLGDVATDVRTRAQIDLTLVSVLIDACAGPDWKCVEPASGQIFMRCEGLGVRRFHVFTAGLFSSDATRPLQANVQSLHGLDNHHMAQAFQVSNVNPLVGLIGRAVLRRRLGDC
ncbi:DUF1688 family protein [Pseudomonas marginalis]|uniref:DUF1688 family protein n=1 Tax=Pseudomonas marginalis TaxID=298 RepID=UPI003BA1FFA8